MEKIKISAVSYLNTKPFIYGLFRSDLADQFDLSLDMPSVCARKLKEGEVDLALTPIAIIPELPSSYLVSDFCIGAEGTVKTVCLYAQKPLREIRRIFLDFHSRTSVALVKVLCREYWNINPEFVPATEGYEKEIQGDTAGVIIGDRTIGKASQFTHVYDLGEAWTAWTRLPFVFAAWVSTRPLPASFVEPFNKALEFGVGHIPELIKVLPSISDFDLEDYFKKYISYELTDAKWEALQRFLGYLAPDKAFSMQRNVLAATSRTV
jgi:chorismate dehydratase